MAITTEAGMIAGAKPTERWWKPGQAAANLFANKYQSLFYQAGNPAAAVAPSPGVNGAALTTYAGQLPFTNPASGNSYLSNFSAQTNVGGCTVLLCDRLWHNSGLNLTISTLQTITPVAIPARDKGGSTNGAGVLVGLEWSTAGQNGTPDPQTITLTYTNSAGTGSRTAVGTSAFVQAEVVSSFYSFPLATGDLGVRSIEGYQQAGTWTSGVVHLVLYRVLASVSVRHLAAERAVNHLQSGFPRLYNDSVPFIIIQPSATTAQMISGDWGYAQG